MRCETFDVGSEVAITARFRDDTGALADPTVVVAATIDGRGSDVTSYTEASPEMTHPSLGVYVLTITVDEPGTWAVRFEGTGAVIAAAETTFRVAASAFATP